MTTTAADAAPRVVVAGPVGRSRATDAVEALAGVALPSRFRDLAAEATGILRWSVVPTAPATGLVAVLDSDAVAARLVAVLGRLGVDDGVVHAEPTRGRWRVVLGAVPGREVARRIGLVHHGGRGTGRLPSWILAGSLPEAVATWRGALLAAGRPTATGTPSVTLPCPGAAIARDAAALGTRLGVRARVPAGPAPDLVVDGPGEAALLLASCGGSYALAAAGLAPPPGRSTAADANATRAAVAASRTTATVADAFAVLEAAGVEIPSALAEAGRLRIAHPDRALVELAALTDPPTSKDALAGRLRRLTALAARRR